MPTNVAINGTAWNSTPSLTLSATSDGAKLLKAPGEHKQQDRYSAQPFNRADVSGHRTLLDDDKIALCENRFAIRSYAVNNCFRKFTPFCASAS